MKGSRSSKITIIQATQGLFQKPEINMVHIPKHTKSDFLQYLIMQEPSGFMGNSIVNFNSSQFKEPNQMSQFNQGGLQTSSSQNSQPFGTQSQPVLSQIQQVASNFNSSSGGQNQQTGAGQLRPEQTLMLTGEKGYRTALCSHVEMLLPQMPLPFFNVQPALRVGFAVYDDQDLELPLGSHSRSYAFSSSGQMVTSSTTQINQGDVIGAVIYLKPPKPKFLQQNPNEEGMEVSHGSYIEFYKNGVKQTHSFLDIYEGTYYAGISLFMQAQCRISNNLTFTKVRINFGETPFKFPPPQIESKSILEKWQPYKDVLKNQRGVALPKPKEQF